MRSLERANRAFDGRLRLVATVKTALQALVGFLFWVSVGAAQPLVFRIEGPTDRVEGWRRAVRSHGATALQEVAPAPPTTPRAQVQVFGEVSELLLRARVAAGNLDEAQALALLVRARELVEDHAHVPGASRWLAEVETSIGTVALHAGMTSVGGAALARAVSLDPSRRLYRGEALPAVVARSQELAAEHATAPEARFEVRADAAGARVYLDDRFVGDAPAEVRATVGRHVLRIEAPGRRPWGRAIDVTVGWRLPVVVRLVPTSRQRALRALATVPSLREAATLTREARVRLWWVEVGGGPRRRALLYECGPSGCSAPVHLQGAWHEPGPPIPWDVLEGARRAARRWLWAGPELALAPPPRPAGRRLRLWVPVGVAAAVLAVGLGVGLRPEASRRLQVRIDPTDLTTD